MTRLEDALRDAFTAEVDASTQQMITDVRRGARRRRNRRTAATAVAAVSVLVAAVAVGGSLAEGGRGRAPEPAPRPTEIASDPGASVPLGAAYAVDAGGDRVLATIQGAEGCGCTELWRLDASGVDARWEKVHEFPEEFVERLELAQDGRFGIAAAPGGDPWITRDGGEAWERAVLDGGRGVDHSFLFTTTGDDRWRAWAVDVVGKTLWRSNGDSFEQVSYDELGEVQDVWGLGGPLVVQTPPRGEGSTDPGLFLSVDDGRRWSQVASPCAGESQPVAGPSSLWMVCASGRHRATVYRFAETWEEFGSVPGAVTGQVALTDDTLLVLGAQDVLVTGAGNLPVDAGLDGEEEAWGGTVLGEPGFLNYCEQEPCHPDDPAASDPAYLATTGGLLLSEDGGRTWHEVAGTTGR